VPELGDVRVRQAINCAINREGLLNAFQHGYGSVTTQAFGPTTMAFVESLNSRYPYDPARARELLAEAGAENFTLPLTIPAETDSALVAQIQQQLTDVGINVELNLLPAGAIFDEMAAGRVAIFPQRLETAHDWRQIQLSVLPTGLFNPEHTENPEVDELLNRITGAQSEAEAIAASQELNTYLVENAWFVPFYLVDSVGLSNDTVNFILPVENITPPAYFITPAN